MGVAVRPMEGKDGPAVKASGMCGSVAKGIGKKVSWDAVTGMWRKIL